MSKIGRIKGIEKNVTNEKCAAEIAKLSSVRNCFWMNHASKKARIYLKRTIFGLTKVPKKMNRIYSVILENWGRNRQKTPQIA